MTDTLYLRAMDKAPENLFKNVEKIAHKVKQDFKQKGIVIPTRDKNGNVVIGKYTIIKDSGLYDIVDLRGSKVLTCINLVETAILIANDLALGKFIDQNLVDSDKWYGYKYFTEQHAKYIAENSKKKDPDRAELSLYMAGIAHGQRLEYKRRIDNRFNKLRKLT